jgi:BMFP domain-containing protein YqiC
MQKDSKLFEDLARMTSGAAGALMDLKRELEATIADKVERLVSRERFVSREEFDVVKAMAEKARMENDRLSAELEALRNRTK